METRLNWTARWLGRRGYTEACALQESLIRARRAGETGDTLLLLEHPPVVTLGRSGDREHLLLAPEELAARGIEMHECGRGGDVTFHGPGQIVGYPIVALRDERRDAHRYLRELEQGLIRAVAHYGIAGERCEGMTGVWVGDEKIAAIGVRLSTGWITSHGFALNIGGDLSGFTTIVPCGLHGRGVTSIERLTGKCPEMADAAEVIARAVGKELGYDAAPAATLLHGAPRIEATR